MDSSEMLRMRFANQSLLLLMLAVGGSQAGAQNTAPNATPQTQGSAPAAIGTGAPGGQGGATAGAGKSVSGSGASGAAKRNSGVRGGTPVTGGSNAAGRGNGGITGVQEYRPGSRGSRGMPAPVANGSMVVTGRSDGGAAQGGSRKNAAGSNALPGVASFSRPFGIAAGTPIQVRLSQPVDSGHARNGDLVNAVLAAPLGSMQAGTPVQLTVVAAAKAGAISSEGELSLQIIRVNGEDMLSDVVTALGKKGDKLTADAAPARGTEAAFPAGKPIAFPAS